MGAPTMKDTFTITDGHAALSTTVPTSSHHNHENIINDENDAVSLEETYTSLIQEYLQVMCLENATFLAERLVATCGGPHRNHPSPNALYMLAVCHYRSGATKRALMVLEDIRDPMPNADYLKAKCCYDLEYYGRAEEALLQDARSEFKLLQAGGMEGNTNHNINKSMDDWILETTPCPIPNGAVGLYLLGNICRKSSRKQRAMKYYRMSLQVSLLLLLFLFSLSLVCERICLRFFISMISHLFHVLPIIISAGPSHVDKL